MMKKIAVLAAALAVSAPAFADRGHGYGHGHAYGHRTVVVQQPRYVVYRPAPVVRHVVYRPAPQPVVVYHRSDAILPLLAGAVIGAAIVHHAVTGY
ncbi:MAG TPA: hypothetical protein VF280_15575 [Burkholderiales bacterium]|jgi:hypothetical protein